MAPTPEEIAAYDAKLAAEMLADSLVQAPPPGRQRGKKRKRTAGSDGAISDEEEDDNDGDGELPILSSIPSPSSGSTSDGNILALARQVATHKRLKPSQLTELEVFAADSAAARQVKLYGMCLSLEGKLAQIVTAAPEFAVTVSLDKNMRQLAFCIMSSVKVSSYKGSVTTAHLMNILKTKRYDLPAGIEFIPSDCARVKAWAEYHLTQCRATLKKFLKASMPPKLLPKEHWNIFVLGQRFVKDTQTVLTVELCARIALMRQRFILYPGEDFYDKLDERLVWIRKQAHNDPKKIAKAFKVALNEDRANHGNLADYKLPEDAVVDSWQLSVDKSILVDGATA
ncbi:hypothetical protein C8R44DRAFT_880459 [Mycena epipterygia]|nr:hypothetical protein C8R44DRAFT_880459 [Mycena epipterygia]